MGIGRAVHADFAVVPGFLRIEETEHRQGENAGTEKQDEERKIERRLYWGVIRR